MTSKKHYVEFAKMYYDTMIEIGVDSSRVQVIRLAKEAAIIFAQDNPMFDRRRFLTACGLLPEEIE